MLISKGGCLCDDLRYETTGQPTRVTMCHCNFCQRATGGAFLVEPIFDAHSFRIKKGEPKVYTHRSTGSGLNVYIHFCDNCGTKLFLTFERFVDVVGVYGGTFDDPNWFDLAPETTKHIFLGVAQRGTVIPPNVNTFTEHASTSDGLPIAPTIYDTPLVINGHHPKT
jgi:hypothetical protein